jgi:hypothetical protein
VRKQKVKINTTVQRAAAVLEEHLATLPKREQTKARNELHNLANAVSRRARGSRALALS